MLVKGMHYSFLITAYVFSLAKCNLVVFIIIKSIYNNMVCHRFRLSGLFYFIFLSLPSLVSYSQQNSTDKQGNLFLLVNKKVDSYLENDFLLMNARILINTFQGAKGRPYFETTNDAPGKLVLGKKEYNNIRLIYDICDQKLFFIAENSSNTGDILELNNQIVTRFYLDDKIFVNSSELPSLPQSGFYEVIFLGKHIKVYARWSKIFIPGITDEYIGEFGFQKRKLLFDINGKKLDVSTKHSFLKIFDGERNKINSYIKMKKIRLSKSNNIDLIKLFKYADSLL